MKKVLFIIVGLVSMVLSIVCFAKDTHRNIRYGGDAYTGIQNTIVDVVDVAKFGFGSVLMVAGLSLVAAGITDKKKEDDND